ncbi:SRPBCC family protein, partial [Inquilinus limosus]|uniref:SRPBCC family protein n=1 Tax=Inquilinus limosus TaxID=171674 RepID=UPI00119822BB
MEMTGEHRIAAPRSVVWEGLNDPEVLRRSIPGCDTLEKTSPTEMTATVTAKVGPVKASFGGQVTLSNLNPPESYTISGEGKGGAAGFAKGGADVKLVEDGDGTLLQYAVKANIGGKLAQLGARLIDGTAKKMADDFFSRFAAEMEQRAAAGGAAAPVPAPSVEPVVPTPAPAAAEIPVPVPVPAETAVTPPSPAEAPSLATAEPVAAPQPVPPTAAPAPK